MSSTVYSVPSRDDNRGLKRITEAVNESPDGKIHLDLMRYASLFLVAGLSAACGSSAGTPGGPVASPTPGAPDGPPVATIKPSGVDPQVLHAFSREQTITFVNDDAVAHDIRSDAHPAHTACSQVNLGTILPGEGERSPARRCQASASATSMTKTTPRTAAFAA